MDKKFEIINNIIERCNPNYTDEFVYFKLGNKGDYTWNRIVLEQLDINILITIYNSTVQLCSKKELDSGKQELIEKIILEVDIEFAPDIKCTHIVFDNKDSNPITKWYKPYLDILDREELLDILKNWMQIVRDRKKTVNIDLDRDDIINLILGISPSSEIIIYPNSLIDYLRDKSTKNTWIWDINKLKTLSNKDLYYKVYKVCKDENDRTNLIEKILNKDISYELTLIPLIKSYGTLDMHSKWIWYKDKINYENRFTLRDIYELIK